MSDGETLVDALLDPANWPHPVHELRLLETHISWVILTGEYAYKIKKPLKLEFLDFSTLELRKRWCEEELRLNSRWAPSLYLDVVPFSGSAEKPVIGGTGEAFEYAVRMREFPQAALLSEQLAVGELSFDDMLELAEMIADRHAQAPANREARFGGHDAIRKPMDENFHYLAPWLDDDELRYFEHWTTRELERHGQLIDARMRDGFVRRCHGDLHLRNLVRLDDGIVAFDCIEFSEELRTLDVISDLSFLAMDLIAAGHAELAWTLLNRYLEVSGDYEGMQLVGLYHVYHCMIRAKVAAILATERDDDEAQKADLEEMHHYCDVARDWIENREPAVVAMHGLSGSGKTWVSSRLARAMGAVRIRSDIERKRMHGIAEHASSDSPPGEGLYDKDKSTATYARLFDLAGPLLDAGHRVILDATMLKAAERNAARSLAADRGLPSSLVVVTTSPEAREARVGARKAIGTDASEADQAVLEFQRERVEPVDDDREQPVVHFENGIDADVPPLVDAIEAIISRDRDQ